MKQYDSEMIRAACQAIDATTDTLIKYTAQCVKPSNVETYLQGLLHIKIYVNDIRALISNEDKE